MLESLFDKVADFFSPVGLLKRDSKTDIFKNTYFKENLRTND